MGKWSVCRYRVEARGRQKEPPIPSSMGRYGNIPEGYETSRLARECFFSFSPQVMLESRSDGLYLLIKSIIDTLFPVDHVYAGRCRQLPASFACFLDIWDSQPHWWNVCQLQSRSHLNLFTQLWQGGQVLFGAYTNAACSCLHFIDSQSSLSWKGHMRTI